MKAPKPEKRLRQISVRTTRRPNFSEFYPEQIDKVTADLAKEGDRESLISMLRNGEEIGPLCRAFLIADLSGNTPRKRGNKKTIPQAQQDLLVFVRVIYAMVDNQITKTAALRALADKAASHENAVPLETLRSQFKRIEKDSLELMPIKVLGKWVLPWQ